MAVMVMRMMVVGKTAVSCVVFNVPLCPEIQCQRMYLALSLCEFEIVAASVLGSSLDSSISQHPSFTLPDVVKNRAHRIPHIGPKTTESKLATTTIVRILCATALQ